MLKKGGKKGERIFAPVGREGGSLDSGSSRGLVLLFFRAAFSVGVRKFALTPLETSKLTPSYSP